MGGWSPLKPSLATRGYYDVRLRDADGRRHLVKLHRLILEAFRGPCPEGCESRHLNDDQTDNRLDNLAWGTSAENKADRDRNGGTARGVVNGRSKLDEGRVLAIRRVLRTGASVADVANIAGVDQRAISLIRDGENWKHVVATDAST